MTLKILIAADVKSVFLDANDFAETITVFPADGSASYTILAAVSEKTKNISDDRNVVAQPESVTLFAEHDAVDGILAPGIGLAIRLENDSDAVRWTFGEIVDEDAAAITVRFEKSGYHKHTARQR